LGLSLTAVSGVLLLEELGCWAFAERTGRPRRNEAARHRKNAGFRWVDDLIRKDTIGVRRSPQV
jgi:hypothetical protein